MRRKKKCVLYIVYRKIKCHTRGLANLISLFCISNHTHWVSLIDERIRILYIKDHYIDTSTYVRYNYFILLKGVFILDTALIYKCEAYMQTCLKDDMAHDPQHMYRVLKIAMDIADHEPSVDKERLIIACLLHDIGRKAQREDHSLCHAEVGGEMAYSFLLKEGVNVETADAIREAIRAHRFRSKQVPDSIEAKILFDADTIDVTGAIGIARSLQYEGNGAIPLYNVDNEGNLILGEIDQPDCFLREYIFKLQNVYDRLYTKHAKEIAQKRRTAAQIYYTALVSEIVEGHSTLDRVLKQLTEDIEI